MEESFLDTTSDIQATMENMGLDQTLLKAAMKMKFMYPTLVQSKLFDLAQERKHIIIKSKARSGKSSGALFVLVNNLIQKILENEDDSHFSIVLCPNKAVCNSTESILGNILHFAKEEYNISCVNLVKVSYSVFENELFLEGHKRLIVIGTPVQFQKMLFTLPSQDIFNNHVQSLFLDELNFLFSFGYEEDLKNILLNYTEKNEEMTILFSLSSEDERVKALKSLIMKNSATIKFDDKAAKEEEKAKIQTLFNEFYFISDDLGKYIALYILFKLKLIAGRTMIICNDIDQMYKVNAFLERSQIKVSKVYNPEWPLKVRQYYLSIFNSGIVNIIVSTKDILEVEKKKPNTKGGIKPCDNIIVMELSNVAEEYGRLTYYLAARNNVPCIIDFLSPDDENKEILFSLLEQRKQAGNKHAVQELPIKPDQMESFKYRCSDVYRGITKKQINLMKAVDFKKLIIKSKNLEEYFEEHEKEKELIVKDVEKMTKKIVKHAVKMEDSVPAYLLGEEEQKRVLEEGPQYVKILKHKPNPNFQEEFNKRLATQDLTEEEVKTSKKRKMDKEQYITINQKLEDPSVTDASRLIPLSGKKLWKIRHKKPLKKVNRRLAKKGIFNP